MSKKKIEEEIDFKALFKNPVRLFGWSFPYFFTLIVIVGIYYASNLNQISFNKQLTVNFDSLNIERDITAKKGGIMPAVELNKISSAAAEMIDNGKKLYEANCASCHGSSGKGDGPAGVALNPKPRNFEAVDGWTNGREFEQFYKTLQEGIIKNGMAAYEYLPVSDRIDIIHYIRSLYQFPPVTPDEVSRLDMTYNLSAGTVVPNRIPVKLAVTKLTNENKNKTVLADEMLKLIEQERGSQYAQIFISNCADKVTAVRSFINSAGSISAESFQKLISSNPAVYGFRGSVTSFNSSEWNGLFEYLYGMMQKANATQNKTNI